MTRWMMKLGETKTRVPKRTMPSMLTVKMATFLATSCLPKRGQNVAVYYDDDFHIGSVSSICTPELAEVNFLKKCAAVNNTYVWPLKPDQAAVQCLFVFDCDFDIVTTTGRVWSVPSHDVLNLKYAVYKQKYS